MAGNRIFMMNESAQEVPYFVGSLIGAFGKGKFAAKGSAALVDLTKDRAALRVGLAGSRARILRPALKSESVPNKKNVAI
jgi:hypothetical protein